MNSAGWCGPPRGSRPSWPAGSARRPTGQSFYMTARLVLLVSQMKAWSTRRLLDGIHKMMRIRHSMSRRRIAGMTGGEVAKNRGLWADLQRELARRQRQQQQILRMEAQAAMRARREYEQAARASARQATADAKERKRLYAEARKVEAVSMASELRDRVAELDSVLTAGIPTVPARDVCFTHAFAGLPAVRRGRVRPSPAGTRLAGALLSLTFASLPDSLGNAVLACRKECLSSSVPLLASFENRPSVK